MFHQKCDVAVNLMSNSAGMTSCHKARLFGIEFCESRVSESLVKSQTLTLMGDSVHCNFAGFELEKRQRDWLQWVESFPAARAHC